MREIAEHPGERIKLPVLVGHACRLRGNKPDAGPLLAAGSPGAKDNLSEPGHMGSLLEKTRHNHFLFREINEQPEAVLKTMGKRSEDAGRLLHELGIAITAKHLRRLHIVGCGSSYYAGLLGRYIIERFAHIPVGIDIALGYRCMEPIITKGTLFVSVSRSGETAESLEAQRQAKRKGAFTVAICNEEDNSCAIEADSVLYTGRGRESGTTSTKTFTAQMAALCLLGIALGIGKEKVTPVEGETLRSLLAVLPRLMKKALETGEAIREISRALAHTRDCLYLGSGINYPIALEARSR